MPAYAMVEVTVNDGEKMSEYRQKVDATVVPFSGRYLIRGVAAEVLEGTAGQHPLKVLIEFPDLAAAKGWYDSDAYQAIIGNRLANSDANFVLIEGV